MNESTPEERDGPPFCEHRAVSAARYLFIAGCPRSGTSALTFLLNEHPQLAIGFERYKRLRAQLDPFHFKAEQFFSPLTAETDIRGELLYERLRARWERGTVKVIGDKVPLYTRVLPQLLDRFPGARVLVLVRDPLEVARSFARRAADPRDWWPAENDHTLAMSMWNEALAAVKAVDAQQGEERIFKEGRVALLPYEALFSGDQRRLEMLVDFVGVPLTARLRAEYERLAKRWQARSEEAPSGDAPSADTQLLQNYVESHRNPELTRWAAARIERQLEMAGKPIVPMPEEDEPPLSARELQEREREREQLLGEMRRPGQRAQDELEVLERRYVEQAGELARRGERLTRGGERLTRGGERLTQGGERLTRGGERLRRGAAAKSAAKLKVTFLAPHQRTTSGGVYVIEQFARHLAREHEVCLAVRERPSRSISGVEVCWAQALNGETLPRADVLVYPADMRDASLLGELPAELGRQVLFFQGYGTPGSPLVEANLAAASESVAIARWLVDLALARGLPCAYVPQGLDREAFAPGSPQRARAARVSLMTHHLEWKGLEDALAAMALVRAERPEVELALFGTEPVRGDGAGEEAADGACDEGAMFLQSPSRGQVAELLRSSAVHVVASWEEGFGLTGAEAIACGAALASTDTKGSRDYAIDGHTALVSAPRDPQALARNVLRLLEDRELRARLVAAGQRHLRTAMPPWEESARRMAFALGAS
ncbi:MAG TPA: glycosyltransferase [Solirubrobacteraceae bacterium]